jgi:PAS domain-containing protein
MIDYEKTKAQLIHELTELRTRCATLEITALECKQLEAEIQDARQYAENIVETVRKPLVVLNSDLKILTANHSFYDTFKVTPEETIGRFIYDLGNRQWDIPKLRILFEDMPAWKSPTTAVAWTMKQKNVYLSHFLPPNSSVGGWGCLPYWVLSRHIMDRCN